VRPHHLLYHIYIAPFAYWGGIGGAKLGQALVIGGIFAATWLLLRRLRIRPAWLWLIVLLALSSPFVYRMMMVRAQGAAVLVLLLVLYALFTRRYRWLLPLAFALQALMENSPGMLLALVAGVLARSLRKSRRDGLPD
jgi:RsiW-degrading membrane proteinase PrsW (M82 family)